MRRAPSGLILAFLLAGGFVLDSQAHQTTDSYLSMSLESGQIKGRWAIALRDLNHVLELDTDKDGEISDKELAVARPKIEKYAFDALNIEIGGVTVPINRKGFEIEEHDDAIYTALLFELSPARIGPDLTIQYDLFFHTDPLHRGLFRLDLPNRTETTIFSPAQPTQRFLIDSAHPTPQLARFIREGIWHIWLGFDHILFLIALLLPSVLHREANRWTVGGNWRQSIYAIVKVVTAFTIAHSITLSLAALGWVRVPPRIVEPIIAASVLIAAVNNLRVIFPERTWIIAFCFGLIHGFGFASALSELGLQRGTLGRALLGFNVGVEIGQLAIVGVFVPTALAIRKTRLYQRLILPGGSLLIATLAAIWMVERILDRKFLPF